MKVIGNAKPLVEVSNLRIGNLFCFDYDTAVVYQYVAHTNDTGGGNFTCVNLETGTVHIFEANNKVLRVVAAIEEERRLNFDDINMGETFRIDDKDQLWIKTAMFRRDNSGHIVAISIQGNDFLYVGDIDTGTQLTLVNCTLNVN